MYDHKTILQIGSPLKRSVTVAGHIPVLADGQTLELDGEVFTVRTTALVIDSQDWNITMYVVLE